MNKDNALKDLLINEHLKTILEQNNLTNQFSLKQISQLSFSDLINRFSEDFEKYLKKFTEQKIQNKNNNEIIIDNIPHEKWMLIYLESLEKFMASFDNKDIEEINEYIINKIILPKNFFGQNDKKIFFEFILKRIKEKPLQEKFIEKILNDLEEKNGIIFEYIDDCIFYEYLILKINYISGVFDYNYNKDIFESYIEIINYKKNTNIIHMQNFQEIFLKQKKLDIIQEMSNFLCQIFFSIHNINYIINNYKQYLIKNIYMIPSMKIFESIIKLNEKKLMSKFKSHNDLCKKNLIKIFYVIENDINSGGVGGGENEKNFFYFYENSTIFEVISFFKKKYKNIDVIYNENEILNKNNYNKSIKDILQLLKEKSKIKILIKNNLKEKLLENGNLSQKFRSILQDIFNFFSHGKKLMNLDDITKFFSAAIKSEITNKDLRIFKLIRKYSSDKLNNILNENDFFNFFLKRINEGKEELVWNNIYNFNYYSDLEKIEETPCLKADENLRYYLSNLKQENNLDFINDFLEKYKESLDINVLNFIFFLSTNIDIYNKILDNDFNANNIKFTEKPKEIIKNFYILIIIESIIEDLSISNIKSIEVNKDNKDNEKLIDKKNIKSENYLPFDSPENIEKKKIFYKNFIMHNYKDLILYLNILFKDINENGIKGKEVIIKFCLRGIEIINNIYESYYDISLEKINDNVEKIKSPKIDELQNFIMNLDIYNDILIQITIFLNKYYINYDFYNNNNDINDKIILENLIKHCYYLLLYLIFTNNKVFEIIINNEQNKANLDKVIKKFLLSSNLTFQLVNIINQKKKNKKEKDNISKLIIYMIDIIFSLLKEINKNELDKIISNNYLFTYIYCIFNYDFEKNIEKIKLKLIDIYSSLYNYINTNNNEKKEFDFIVNMIIMKKLLDFPAKKLKEVINNYKINGKNLYELIIERLLNDEKNKLKKNKEKLNKINILTNQQNNKFISYNELNNIKTDENISLNYTDEMLDYCIWYLNIKKENKMKIIINLLNELKKEELLNNNNNISNIVVNNSKLKINKKKSEFTGLKNIGNTCYLNSVIQIFFMIPELRFLILSIDDGKDKIKGEYLEDDNMLHQLQILFTNLLLSSESYVNTQNFFLSLKDSNNAMMTTNQKDSQEFYLELCDKLETMVNVLPEKFLIKNFFCGKISHKSTCNSCNNISENFEEFKSLSIEVENLKNLEESLTKYFSEEIIEDYQCSNCNKKVNLNRYTKFSELPNYLVIHLKRIINNFTTDELIKVNSKFEFDTNLNLKKFSENFQSSGNIQYNNEIKDEEEKYEYLLKAINVHMGNAEGGHYVSIIYINDKKEWYEFDDTYIREFNYNIQNLEEVCFGGPDKFKTAYLLFYEKVKKNPVIKLINSGEINEKSSILENNLSDNNNPIELNRIYYDKNQNIYYKYEEFEKLEKNDKIRNEYFMDIYYNSKIYQKFKKNSEIFGLNNNFIKMLLMIIKDKFNLKEYEKDNIYGDLLNIVLKTILSYYNEFNYNDNDDNDIILIIQEIIIPMINKNINNKNQMYKLLHLINSSLFNKNNFMMIFSGSLINEEVTNKMYELFINIIKLNDKDTNENIFKYIISILNEANEDISSYIYQIIFEFIKNGFIGKLVLDNMKNLFMTLFYKFFNENGENIFIITNILKYLIVENNLLKQEYIEEVLKVFNQNVLFNLFDINLGFLIILIQKLQFNNKVFSDIFNTNYIQKLYTYCDKKKIQDNKIKIKLIKFIFGILEIIDKYAFSRFEILLGYPNLVILEKDEINKNSNSLNFGINIMNNNINEEIFEYISYNHIIKERCVLANLFPSKYNKNMDILEENDRLDLIYELIEICFGYNQNKNGNYFLFKYIYLMQPRNMKYENLYEEMKSLLNSSANKKYNLTQIQSKEKKCIEIINYEKGNLEYIITLSAGVLSTMNRKEKYKSRPELPNEFKECNNLMDERMNTDYYGFIVNMVPYQVSKIYISLIASNENMSIFRFEYYTNYFTKKELLTFDDEQKNFSYENIRREPNDESKINFQNYEIYDLNAFFNKNFTQFLIEIDNILKGKQGVLIENKLIDDNTCKKYLIRYFVLSKKKNNVLKISSKLYDITKDIEKNFYLPNLVFDSIEKFKWKNILNIHRIKHNFKFLEHDHIGTSFSNLNYDKYFNEYFNNI